MARRESMLAGVRGAFFVACSWTWCIGMFLPVLLIRDFGGWGWVSFAVPNVVGAMSVGLVLGPERARRLLEEHRWVVGAFIVWTVAFHAYFLSFWLGRYGMVGEWAPLLWVLVFALAAPMVLLRFATMGWVAVAVWVASMALFWWIPKTGAELYFALPEAWGDEDPVGLVWMGMALALGFLACPFLDGSLLRARVEAPGRVGGASFVVGFGVLFLVLIGMTALYARMFEAGAWFSHWLYFYFALQGWFTVSALVREARAMRLGKWWWAAMVALVVAAGVAGGVVAGGRWFEWGYEVFLTAYALVFPAYVWTVVLVWGLTKRARLVGFGVTVAVAAPFFALGAFWDMWWGLGVGTGAVLLGPLVGHLWGESGGVDGRVAEV